MMCLTLGACLIGGSLRGWLENLKKPTARPLKEHTPVYLSDRTKIHSS